MGFRECAWQQRGLEPKLNMIQEGKESMNHNSARKIYRSISTSMNLISFVQSVGPI